METNKSLFLILTKVSGQTEVLETERLRKSMMLYKVIKISWLRDDTHEEILKPPVTKRISRCCRLMLLSHDVFGKVNVKRKNKKRGTTLYRAGRNTFITSMLFTTSPLLLTSMDLYLQLLLTRGLPVAESYKVELDFKGFIYNVPHRNKWLHVKPSLTTSTPLLLLKPRF
eukprot:gene7178-14622_t